jgi:hypothetical protein
MSGSPVQRIQDLDPAQVDDLLTTFPEVVEELTRRQQDDSLRKKVAEYLANDIPEHFKEGPVLYLARHIATPNFETLRFLHLTESIDIRTIIGQDTKDRFVAHNPLKKALGKLPVCTGMTQNEKGFTEQFQNISIFDFNTESGKAFVDIRTYWDEPLVDFHTSLFKHFANHEVTIVDDSPWIDRNHRGNLLAHYQKFLALFVVNGILFEDYLVEDKQEGEFVRNVLRPAFKQIEHDLGVRPLITQLTPTSIESASFWISYPKEVLDAIRQRNNGSLP